ncbi:PucR family transcriptional regulator [Microbacterium sp. A204]|uniref:PucR family transcriptional regulator n=1 Tax=Microbacterium sp. A204 TaxID=3457321 RepID=UPI003FD50877
MDQPTLRALLNRGDLGLRLITEQDDGVDRVLRWVHSSDLADPTPFLADDLALLTTGSQFRDGNEEDIAEYVTRLAAHGIVGLGFGTGVQQRDVPERLIEACADAGIPLFEVPYDTPFIAIARAHAEAIAAQTYARQTWALDTHRALAIAALRPRGLESALTELARRLDRWVGMFDASGVLVHEHPQQGVRADEINALTARATELLSRGTEAGQSLTLGTESFTLFTLGRTGHLRGLIGIGTASLDAQSRTVVTSVIAMAGLAVEQNEQLTIARRRLRTSVLESLLLDDPTLARHVLGSIPSAPIVVAIADSDASADALDQWWKRQRAGHGTMVLDADSDLGLTMVVTADDAGLFDELAASVGIRIGVSDPEDYEAFSRAHTQAGVALTQARSQEESAAVHYADTIATSILGVLATDEARLVAQSRLAPLHADGRDLEHSLRTWLAHDARIESAAEALGIHRHTLRARIADASRLLGMDLSSFPARAELWAALQTA